MASQAFCESKRTEIWKEINTKLSIKVFFSVIGIIIGVASGLFGWLALSSIVKGEDVAAIKVHVEYIREKLDHNPEIASNIKKK